MRDVNGKSLTAIGIDLQLTNCPKMRFEAGGVSLFVRRPVCALGIQWVSRPDSGLAWCVCVCVCLSLIAALFLAAVTVARSIQFSVPFVSPRFFSPLFFLLEGIMGVELNFSTFSPRNLANLWPAAPPNHFPSPSLSRGIISWAGAGAEECLSDLLYDWVGFRGSRWESRRPRHQIWEFDFDAQKQIFMLFFTTRAATNGAY